MGSSPSVVEVPEGHMVGDGQTTRRYQGFQEVEMADPEGHVASASAAPSHSKEQMQRAAEVALHADDPLAGEGADLYSVVGQMQRQKTTLQLQGDEFEQPNYEEEEDLVLETFYHQNGTSFTCVYQGGQRFYLDSWETQDWQPFPKSWYKEGVLVTDKVLKNSDQADESAQPAEEQKGDDREGILDHPTRGTLTTYIFEEKRNIHYFFDKDTGAWIRLPIAWELQSELVKQLIEPIQEALPEWKDTHDILAALRSSNYDPHDCIATYLATGSSNEMQTPRNSGDAKAMEQKDQKMKELNKTITKLKQKLEKSNKSLQQEKEERKRAENMVGKLREQISDMEVKVSTSIAQVEAIQRERPKTARPKSAAPKPQPTVGDVTDPETILELNENAKLMHKDHVKLKMEAKQKFEEMKAMFKQLAVGITKISLCDHEQGKEVEELKELYRREALQRKMLYNKLQELRGNIRVFCRCRNDDRASVCHQFNSDREILPPTSKKPFKFDKVFKPESTQEEVFEEVKSIITSCVDGFSVCLLAYGQTGSGKTFTMNGTKSLPGVNVRSIRELLNLCSERENVQYSLKASMVEIYNECIQDLLTSQNRQLEVKAKGKSIHLPGMTEMFVENEKDIEKILELGDQNRSVAATKMNSTSSRSHLVFMITVEGRDKASGASSVGTLTLCDLAGSERVAKTEAQGQRLVEAAAINKSLTSLGQVFTSLRTGQLHIPYRNSKLTHILQPCLGGDAKAALFVTVSPDIDNVTESISTLTFGSNARQVTLGRAKQNVKRPGPGQNTDAWGVSDA